jgi:PTS system nitrogen regulatory IIA component
MKIVDLISRERVIPALSSTGKVDILEELAGYLADGSDTLDRDQLARVLIDREGLASTAIGQGVAIPHGKLPNLDRILACLGRAKSGVDFDSMDGKPTYLFFVMVAPENSAGAHLKALARISRVFKDEAFRKQLLGAADGDAMFELIRAEDEKY